MKACFKRDIYISTLPYFESCGMMERVKGSVNESASIPNYTNCSPWKRSRRPTRSAYFSGIQSNLKRSKENPSLPPPSIERSVYFVDSCASSAWSFDWGSAFTERAVDAFRACPKFAPLGVRHLCERRCYLRAYEVFTIQSNCSKLVQAITDVPLL